jgi:hypothetical protein
MSTEFDPYDADVYGSETLPALQVEMDLEKAQTTETDIKVLVTDNNRFPWKHCLTVAYSSRTDSGQTYILT